MASHRPGMVKSAAVSIVIGPRKVTWLCMLNNQVRFQKEAGQLLRRARRKQVNNVPTVS